MTTIHRQITVSQVDRDRFGTKIRIDENDHWLLRNPKRPNITVAGEVIYARTAAWLLFVGPLGAFDTIDNTCGIKGCLNPDHHELRQRFQPKLKRALPPAC